jgi:hypothetical protein
MPLLISMWASIWSKLTSKFTLSQVLDELDIMNDSDSGLEFEDNTELDADYDVNFDNSGDSDSGNDTDVHGIQSQGQGGTNEMSRDIVLTFRQKIVA